MKMQALSTQFVLLVSAISSSGFGAMNPCPDEAEAAEAERSCKEKYCPKSDTATYNSTMFPNGCSDVEYHGPEGCPNNQAVHCGEIVCCPACEDQVRLMYDCEHGSNCGYGLQCQQGSPTVLPVLGCSGFPYLDCYFINRQ